jgi:lipoprotein NlpD
MGVRIKIFLCLGALLVLVSCSVVQLQDTDRPTGVYHKVRSGETLWRISQAYGVSMQDIAEVNNITDPAMVTAGTVLFIPDAHRVVDLPPVEKKPEKKEVATQTPPPVKGSGGAAAKEYAPPKGKAREEGIIEKTTPKGAETAQAPLKSQAAEKPKSTTKGAVTTKPAPAAKPSEGAPKAKAGTASASPAAKPEVKEKAPSKPADRAVASAKSYEPVPKATAAAPVGKDPTLEDVRKRLREEERMEKAGAEKESGHSLAPAASAEKKPGPAVEKTPAAKAEPEKARKPAPAEEKKQLARVAPEPERKRVPVEEPPGKIDLPRGKFAWPVKGKVTSKYGIQANGMKNNGIRISAKEGSPVVASAGGTVIYSAPLKFYGDTVLLKHDDNYVTVYTNLKDRVVKKDDRVRKGEKLALLGKPGDGSDGSFLYFEIRHNNKARNPLFFLP